MDKVEGFDKAEHSLHAVNLALWEGFIFVNLAEKPLPLEEWFAPIDRKVHPLESAETAFREAD